MSKRPGSNRWLQRQQRDQFVRQAKQSEYRSRAVYKLREIDERDKLIKPGQRIIDLGAAPGSWSQYAVARTGLNGLVLAIDCLPVSPIDNVLFIQGDFTEQATLDRCLETLGEDRTDLVLSDMAPNISGIRATDQARSIYLAELAKDLAVRVLKQNGDLLIKLFQGEGVDPFRDSLKEHFGRILTRKPRASRDISREFYILARTFGR